MLEYPVGGTTVPRCSVGWEGHLEGRQSGIMVLQLAQQMANLSISAKPVSMRVMVVAGVSPHSRAGGMAACGPSGAGRLTHRAGAALQTLKRFEGFKAVATFKNAPTARAVQVGAWTGGFKGSPGLRGAGCGTAAIWVSCFNSKHALACHRQRAPQNRTISESCVVAGVQVAFRKAPLRIECARVGGVEIPNQKYVEYSLQYIYGIGPTTAKAIVSSTVSWGGAGLAGSAFCGGLAGGEEAGCGQTVQPSSEPCTGCAAGALLPWEGTACGCHGGARRPVAGQPGISCKAQ